VVWVADSEPEQFTVTTETAVPPTAVNHYHLHIEASADAAAILRQATESRNAQE
jgi:hypothetical protein